MLSIAVGFASPAPAQAASCTTKANYPVKPASGSSIFGYGSISCSYRPQYLKLWVMVQKYNGNLRIWETKGYRYDYNYRQSVLGFNASVRCSSGLWRTRTTSEVIGSMDPNGAGRITVNGPTRRFSC